MSWDLETSLFKYFHYYLLRNLWKFPLALLFSSCYFLHTRLCPSWKEVADTTKHKSKAKVSFKDSSPRLQHFHNDSLIHNTFSIEMHTLMSRLAFGDCENDWEVDFKTVIFFVCDWFEWFYNFTSIITNFLSVAYRWSLHRLKLVSLEINTRTDDWVILFYIESVSATVSLNGDSIQLDLW